MNPFEVTSKDIAGLKAREFARLLHDLLISEAETLGLPKERATVSLDIDIPDGGEDGLLEWKAGPEPSSSNWIPARCSLVQAKAMSMSAAVCAAELVGTDGKLKVRVQRVVDAGGGYVLFNNHHLPGLKIDARVAKMRERMTALVGAELADAVTIRVYGAEKIAEWTNEYASAAAYVHRCHGRQLPVSFQPWDEWKAEWDGVHEDALAFHHASRRAEIEILRGHLARPGAMARLVGLSGLGKSRLALEAFAPADPSELPSQAALSVRCVYVNNGADREHEVVDAVRGLQRRGVRGIVVVDECPLSLHEKLASVVSVSDSRLSLLTLDYDTEGKPRSSRCKCIRLGRLENEATEALLIASHPHLSAITANRIVTLARGNPQMVEVLARAALDPEARLWDLEPRALVKRAVVRREADEDGLYAVAKTLALFSNVAIYGNNESRIQVLAAEFCDVKDPGVFYRHVRNLLKAGIVERRGDYVRLTPLPLALMLAREWWDECHEERALALLSGDTVPRDLVDALSEHLTGLRGVESVELLVEAVLGPDRPLGSRKGLNSEARSRLVSRLSEINPPAACRALTRVFGHLSVAEVQRIDKGRQNIIRAAQKLAWWSDTFADAAWLLLLFGAGEMDNGSSAKHASEVFEKLFHVYLSGTRQPALKRLDVLERGLLFGSPEIERLCVAGLVAAFRAGDYSRTGGVESQAHGLPDKDWAPAVMNDICDYWRATSRLIEPYVIRADGLGELVRHGLARQARGIARTGGLNILTLLIDRVRAAQLPWPEMLGSLREAQRYEKSQLSQETLEQIAAVVGQLEPANLRERLRYLVSEPGWGEVDEGPAGKLTIVAEKRAYDLGREVAASEPSIADHFSELLQGEQRQALVFGEALGSHTADPLALLRRGGDLWIDVPAARRGSALLRGLCRASVKRDEAQTRAYIRGLLRDDATRPLALDLLRTAQAEDGDIIELTTQLRSRALQTRTLWPLSMGGALNPPDVGPQKKISPETLSDFFFACCDCDSDGARVALDLLGMRLFNSDMPEGLKEFTRSLITDPRLLAKHSLPAVTSNQHYKRLVDTVLTWELEDDYVRKLAGFIMASCHSDAWDDRTLQALVGELLKRHPEIGWQELRRAMEADDWANDHSIGFAIVGFDDCAVDIVSLVGPDRLLNWCAEESRAAPVVVGMIDVLRPTPADDKFGGWTPLAMSLLDAYGNRKDLLHTFAARMHSGFWGGDAVPRLKRRHAAFEQLLAHSVPEVVEWAYAQRASLELQIDEEKKRGEEMEFGIFR